jgi:hypothetical protein
MQVKENFGLFKCCNGGGAMYKSNPVDPQRLKAAWFQPLNLSSEKLVSRARNSLLTLS